MAHTPGPWIIFHVDNVNTILPAMRDGTIAELIMNEDDAYLIAAAPDLLLAVQSMCVEIADYMAINKLGDPNKQHNYRLAMAALAKATP